MRRLIYIHERPEWPHFIWDQKKLSGLLAQVRHSQGLLLGRMEALGFALRNEATLQTLTYDILKTSEIEGEALDAAQVRSSVATKLGMDVGGALPIDRHVEGIVAVMLDATRNYSARLTTARLFDWHAALFPTGRSGMRKIAVGKWRTAESGDMKVVSGPAGREKIHYEAPRYDRIKKEMAEFIKWFNAPSQIDAVLKSALAHFWFVTIHPFDDGNGRIARALADMVLAKSEKSPNRFYSMSSQIQRERSEYYHQLEAAQKGSLNITGWIEWFLSCFKNAIAASEESLATVLAKAKFWEAHTSKNFNERQRKMLNLLFDGFLGKLTSTKWAKLTKCSQDTALRDITALLDWGILKKDTAGGRSTGYEIVLD